MSAKELFGTRQGEPWPGVNPDAFNRWLDRCVTWAQGVVALRNAGITDRNAQTSLSIKRKDGSETLVLAAQSCPNLREISLRGGTLSDSALQAIALAMRGRLKSLDLHGTRGFSDVGLKALAAFCTGLEMLKVGGCAVSDDGLEKVAIFCHHLKLLEVSDIPTITDFSLSHLGTKVTFRPHGSLKV